LVQDWLAKYANAASQVQSVILAPSIVRVAKFATNTANFCNKAAAIVHHGCVLCIVALALGINRAWQVNHRCQQH
jgi:hypothetical protein